MPLAIKVIPHLLKFKFDAVTSRGRMKDKRCWFIIIRDDLYPNNFGIGECGPLSGLSIDYIPEYEIYVSKMAHLFSGKELPHSVEGIYNYISMVPEHLPSIKFGFETAFLDLFFGGTREIFDGSFTKNKPLQINGLVWMGNINAMQERLHRLVNAGFSCIKMKIGGQKWEEELALLRVAREKYGNSIEIRVDANGAFSKDQALQVMDRLARLGVHSIEQPIKAGNRDEMAWVCRNSSIPVALDEELIGVAGVKEREELLDHIQPSFIILKPSLIGGFQAASKWIELAEQRNIGWWITSALESNIGLNAICQFAATYNPSIPQGLGTGSLYSNNISSPLEVESGYIRCNDRLAWDLTMFQSN